MVTFKAVPVTLTLAELEAYDPTAPAHSVERDFCCPLPACADKPVDRAHRSLGVNVTTGLWYCQRCHARGQLKDFWTTSTLSPRARAREAFRRAYMPKPPPDTTVMESESAWDWRTQWDASVPITDTPGAAYLQGRGVPVELADVAGVRYSRSWAGRRAVLFPLHSRYGELVAVNGRYLDTNAPKTRTGGRRALGVFAALPCPAIWRQDPLVLVEGPMDVLSLALVDVPAFAPVGTNLPAFVPELAAFRPIAMALDADAAGDDAAQQHTPILVSLGATVARWRVSDEANDWNGALQTLGESGLRAFVTELRDVLVPPLEVPVPDPSDFWITPEVPECESPETTVNTMVTATETQVVMPPTRCRYCHAKLSQSRVADWCFNCSGHAREYLQKEMGGSYVPQ